jgi:hypothetical protein
MDTSTEIYRKFLVFCNYFHLLVNPSLIICPFLSNYSMHYGIGSELNPKTGSLQKYFRVLSYHVDLKASTWM